jgi:hypothetical protein
MKLNSQSNQCLMMKLRGEKSIKKRKKKKHDSIKLNYQTPGLNHKIMITL